MITRDIETELRAAALEYPVVTILGPRQSGKTTLVRMVFPEKPYRNLEEPDVRAIAEGDPRGFLGEMPEGGILDEVQRVPEILSYVQGTVDSRAGMGQFILTGSHQPLVHQAISRSLAGRTAVLTLLPLTFDELRHHGATPPPFELIWQGTFPGLHQHGLEPDRFFNSYIQTYVERDVPALIQLKDLRSFQRFLALIAGHRSAAQLQFAGQRRRRLVHDDQGLGLRAGGVQRRVRAAALL